MTFEAQLVPGSERYRVRTAEEHEQAFRSAERHSRNVAVLRKVLPVVAVLILATYFISTRLSVTVGGVTASVSGVGCGVGGSFESSPQAARTKHAMRASRGNRACWRIVRDLVEVDQPPRPAASNRRTPEPG